MLFKAIIFQFLEAAPNWGEVRIEKKRKNTNRIKVDNTKVSLNIFGAVTGK